MALYINGVQTGGGGGGGSNYQELTQAEYDALSQAEKENGTVYYITDVNGDGSQFQPVIYSENEREIGVWTDGKPLYERTFDLGSSGVVIPQQQWYVTDVDVSYVELITDCKVCNSTGGGYFGYFGAVKQAANDKLGLLNTRNTDQSIRYVTIQYTKTSDTAGSGTWTPQGVPSVHYSTDEQVVGTWIDGSPVYQKTYVATINTQWGTEPAYDIGEVPTGFDVLISAEGSVRTQNGVGYATFAGIDNITGWSYGLHITGTPGHILLYGGQGNISNMNAIYNGTCVVTLKYTKSAS